MPRIRFLKKGDQRKFLKLVLEKTNCPSLRDFEQFGFNVNYSTMKNYFSESRLLPKELFDNMCYLAKIDSSELEFEIVEDNWGKVKGGKKSKRN